jgi:HEAT repeat protein
LRIGDAVNQNALVGNDSMEDLEKEIRRRYLDCLDDPDWYDDEPNYDFGEKALPYFIAAFMAENCPERRELLIRVIWQFRTPAVLPALAIALNDPSVEVWKNALDGLVAIGGDQARRILIDAGAKAAAIQAEAEKLEWINEALTQLTDSVWEKKKLG